MNALLDVQLLASVSHLFLAGTETTATTLRWGILLLSTNANIQEKCYEEMMAKIGKDRLPQFSDRTQLPYLGKKLEFFSLSLI